MEILNEIIENIINYGNCEFFVRDNRYPNAALKYMFFIDEKHKISIKRYWYAYENNLDSEERYLETKFVGASYLGDSFCVNLAEVIASSIKNECYCTYNVALENNNGGIFASILISFIKNVLLDQEELLREYFKGDLAKFVAFILNKIFALFADSESVRVCPIPLEELIENFMDGVNIGKHKFLKLSKTKTADEYDKVLNESYKK